MKEYPESLTCMYVIETSRDTQTHIFSRQIIKVVRKILHDYSARDALGCLFRIFSELCRTVP